MADLKISALADGGNAQTTDEFVVARGATNVKIAGSGLAAAIGGSITAKEADYLIIMLAGGGCQAINGTTGVVDYSTASTTDHAPVFQSAVNQLLTAGGPSNGLGGTIAFKGQFVFNSQLIIYPNISLVGAGGGAPGYKPVSTAYGNMITSTYNGSTILITGDARGATFTFLGNFSLYGNNGGTKTLQNGIEIAGVAGGDVVKDIHFEHLFIDQMGKHGIFINGDLAGTPKLWCHAVMIEFCAGNGIHHTSVANGGGKLYFSDGYITSNTGNGYDGSGLGSGGATVQFLNTEFNGNTIGVVGPANPTAWSVSACKFSSNTSAAINFSGSTANGSIVINGNAFTLNGANGGNQITGAAPAATSNVNIDGNSFADTRGASAVANHISLAGAGAFVGQITSNTFSGSQAVAVVWTSRSTNKLIIRNNRGYNDTQGKITNAFHTTALRIGAAGNAAAPTASTAYAVEGSDVYIVSTAGTGVSISILDAAGNTIVSGLTTFTGPLLVGFSINFGAFSVAPTLYVGVV